MSLWTTLPEDHIDSPHTHIVQVANGQNHGLLLTDEGVVYSWGGKNEHGQLGRSGPDKTIAPITETIRDEVIVQVACGLNHCLVLAQNGSLFAWGHNKAGQLGVEGFKSKTPVRDLDVRKPVRVKGFNSKDVGKQAKSISCGPESSACITLDGEVYVWGAIGYYVATRCNNQIQPGENFTVPLRVRGGPEVCKPLAVPGEPTWMPSTIALYKDKITCTLGPERFQDDLGDLIKSWKKRSQQLHQIVKSAKSDEQSNMPTAGHEGDEPTDLKNLSKELKTHKREITEQAHKIRKELARISIELEHVGRELTICFQQDTALEEFTSNLEVKKDNQATSRALETQLNDIDYFRNSNKSRKLQFYEQRETLGRQKMRLEQDLNQAMQLRLQIEGQEKLIQSLRRGDVAGKSTESGESGVRLAVSKCDELAATDTTTLSGKGRFSGFGEVMSISERALRDVASSLKEVSAATSSGDGLLEGLLELNLKLRKECTEMVKNKVQMAEKGKGRKKNESMGMAGFFQEVSQKEMLLRRAKEAQRSALKEQALLGGLSHLGSQAEELLGGMLSNTNTSRSGRSGV